MANCHKIKVKKSEKNSKHQKNIFVLLLFMYLPTLKLTI